MRVSVVVIGRNEGERLLRCLASVRAANWAEAVELIYVDSASSDDSVAAAARFCDQVVSVVPLHPSAALGRNAGWRVAGGEFILFLDGDTVLAPNFITDALAAMSDASVAAVWGHRREMDPGQSLWTAVMDLDWVYPPGFTDYCGGDVLMRRAVLAQVDGFDETLIAGEEPELCRRIRAQGWHILHIDCAMTGHDLAIRQFSQYWRRAVRAGHAYAQVADRFSQSDDPLWRDVVRSNRIKGSFWVAWLLLTLLAAALSPTALFCLLALLIAISVRTAIRVRWKATIAGCSSARLLAYGVHSQFQHVPILWGQIKYHHDLRRGRHSRLIEYK